MSLFFIFRKMAHNNVLYNSAKAACQLKIWFFSYGPKYSQPIRLLGSLIINISGRFFFCPNVFSPIVTTHRTAGKVKAISLTPLHHFHPLHRRRPDISQAITVESSPQHIASSWNQTGSDWFVSASH